MTRCVAAGAMLLAGCSANPERHTWLVDSLSMQGERKPGLAIGFNLDGQVSEEGDEASCGHGDYRTTGGRAGVDNQLTAMLPTIEAIGGDAVHELLQRTIDDANLLVLFDVLQHPEPSMSTLRVARGMAPALSGADGRLVSGQTLSVNPNLPESDATEVFAADSYLRARGMSLDLPISVLGYDIAFTLLDARLELWLDEHGGSGVLGGYASLDQVQETLDAVAAGGDPGIAEAVEVALEAHADLVSAGSSGCDGISMALALTVVPAWIDEESP